MKNLFYLIVPGAVLACLCLFAQKSKVNAAIDPFVVPTAADPFSVDPFSPTEAKKCPCDSCKCCPACGHKNKKCECKDCQCCGPDCPGWEIKIPKKKTDTKEVGLDFEATWDECQRNRQPIVCWVNQSGPVIPYCRTLESEGWKTFKNTVGAALFLPTGQRIDLYGTPSVQEIYGLVFPAPNTMVVQSQPVLGGRGAFCGRGG